ncbi:cytochrome c oxidase subunit 1, partial [Cladochytrium tenue]
MSGTGASLPGGGDGGSGNGGGDAFDWVDDMTALPTMTEAAILENLRARFAAKKIYTYCGSILVAVNPFEQLDIYSTTTAKRYSGKLLSANQPHIFGIADMAYGSLRRTKTDQSVVISGESGAGKSESTKYILSYLSSVSGDRTNQSWIQQQILEANTVLESFGNAKTVRNNNSSRYGKFIQLYFNSSYQIDGANIASYLLEKSRIARQAPTERSYHVFYELIAGVSDEERKRYRLPTRPEEFTYLSQSGCTAVPGISDSALFERLKLALAVLNMGAGMVDAVFSTLSAVLWIGNLTFTENFRKDAVQLAAPADAEVVADLLGLTASQLVPLLCTRKLVVRNETTVLQLSMAQATENRDAFAKLVYETLFQKILTFINSSLSAKTSDQMIGILDIFGFEEFEVNSFEQLCINYTNEKLQQYFTLHIFKMEQEEYKSQGVPWESIPFVDNAQCVEMIECKPSGIMPLLDEETKVPKGADESWLAKLSQQHAKHKYFVRPKITNGTFGIKHYAGEVFYTATGFLDKNKDAVQEGFMDLLQSSSVSNELNIRRGIAELFQKTTTGDAAQKLDKQAARQSVGGLFRTQLSSLVSTLGSTECHYVRCVKPNDAKSAFTFEGDLVLSQLRYSGLLETIKIRKSGYPLRMTFEAFVAACGILLPTSTKSLPAPDAAVAVLKAVGMPADQWYAGKTKLFFKEEGLQSVYARADELRQRKITVVQSLVRGRQVRHKYLASMAGAVIIQRRVRAYLEKCRFRRKRRATILIQAVVRGWFARDYYRALVKEREEEEKRKAEEEAAAALAAARELAAVPELPSVDTSALAKEAEELRNLTELSMASAAADDKAKLDNIFAFLDLYKSSSEIGELAADVRSQIQSAAVVVTTGSSGPAAVHTDSEAATMRPSTKSEETALPTAPPEPKVATEDQPTPSQATAIHVQPSKFELSVAISGPGRALSDEFAASMPVLAVKSAKAIRDNPLKKEIMDSSEQLSFDPFSEEWSIRAFAEKNFEINARKKDLNFTLTRGRPKQPD